jgi:hypothetical protein
MEKIREIRMETIKSVKRTTSLSNVTKQFTKENIEIKDAV